MQRPGVRLLLVVLLVPMAAGAPCAEPAYELVRIWGSPGSGDGQFNWPDGVAVGLSGEIYAADTSNGRVQIFDADGTFLAKWDSVFYRPLGVAVDASGNVFVADANNTILKLDAGGTVLATWGSHGTGDGQFDSPRGIAADAAGNVYVTDSNNHRVQKFDGDGAFLAKWGSPGAGDGQFESPRGIAVDGDGGVFVADAANSRIQKFDGNGTFLARWGSLGAGDGQFNWPYGVATDAAGHVYVTDYFNHRIQKFDGNGGFRTKWSAPLFYPLGLAVDEGGSVYVLDSSLRMLKFAPAPQPPVFCESASPACGSTFDQVALKTLTFPVRVVDPNPGTIRLELVAGSPGALTPASPVTGPSPVEATFAWTPALEDAAGNPHTITFRATDDTGRESECTLTVNVRGDSDGDGLPDAWETDGYTLDGEFVDLPSMGADPDVRDVFVEIDYMVGADHTHRPLDEALDLVRQSFAARGIVLHVHVDGALAHDDVLGAGAGNSYDWTEFDAIRAGHFSDAKALAIHYCLFVHDIPNGTSGLARGATASNFIVSLGSFTGQVGSLAQQAGTFMHELGHDLGLKHGGGDKTNRKPNYLSVMNYMFQMTGLRRNGGYGVFDYSGTELPALVEYSLDESAGIGDDPALAGYGTHWFYNGVLRITDTLDAIDWNGNGTTETSLYADINDDNSVFAPLTGHDDWANLDFKSGNVGTGVPLPPPPVTEVEELTPAESETLLPDGPSKVRGHVSNKMLHLTWKPSGNGTDGVLYRVYRSEGGADPVLLGETRTTEFDDKTVEGGKTYTYCVTWVDAFGTESAGSSGIALELKTKK